MRAVWGAAVAVLVTTGCASQHVPEAHGPPRVAPRTVLVVLLDTSFTPFEEANVMLGFDSWVTAVGPDNLGLRYGRIEHPEDKVAPRGVAYVTRMPTRASIWDLCEHQPDAIACWKSGNRNIVLAMGAIEEASSSAKHDLLTTVAAHELGHVVVGHDHRPKPSVLAEGILNDAPVPQPDDIRAFCLVNGCR